MRRKFIALFAVLCAVIMGLFVFAAQSSAHTPRESLSCSAWSVDLTNYAAERPAKTHTEYEWKNSYTGKTVWKDYKPKGGDKLFGWTWDGNTKTVTDRPAEANHVTVKINGVTVADSDFGSSFHDSGTLNGQNGNRLQITVRAWDSSRYNVDYDKTTSGCVRTISIGTAPSATSPTCTTAGHLVLPSQEGVIWSGGENGDGPGGYHLTASAEHGYQLTGRTTWHIIVKGKLSPNSNPDCRPTQPADQTQTQDVTDAPDCSAYTVTIEHQSRTRSAVWDDQSESWAWGQWSDWTTDSTSTVDSTDQQCPPSVITPGQPTTTNDVCVDGVPGGVTQGGITLPADTEEIAYSFNKHHTMITATVVGEHVTFQQGGKADGWHFASDGLSATLYPVQPTDLQPTDCSLSTTPVVPMVDLYTCDSTTGQESGPSIVTPEDTDAISYTLSDDGLTLTASLAQYYTWAQLPEGWTLNQDGTAVYSIPAHDGTCEKVVPSTPNTPSSPDPSTPAPEPTPSSTTKVITVTASPSHTEAVHVDADSSTATPKSTTTAAKSSDLAQTGFDSGRWIGLAIAAAAIGALLLAFGLRRRHEH